MQRLTVLTLLLMAAACSAEEAQPRTVSVSGTGTVAAAPDGAIVSMSISARESDLATAQARAGKVTDAVLKLADTLGISDSDIDTTGASVRPDYRWDRQREEQVLRGYIADRQMSITVDDLDLLGRLIEGAVAAGVNVVSPPQLTSSKRDDAYREALKLAAEDARDNANVLAKTLDASLGPAMTVNASVQVPSPMPQVRMAAQAEQFDMAATYNPGDLSIRATVNVTFELGD